MSGPFHVHVYNLKSYVTYNTKYKRLHRSYNTEFVVNSAADISGCSSCPKFKKTPLLYQAVMLCSYLFACAILVMLGISVQDWI